jgi:catechol 2,3-dioxygenase-like lactoylglutathione lyase family enzyme
MRIEGIDEITYGVEDFDTCKRFFADWGLELVSEQPGKEVIYCTLNDCRVRLIAAADPGRAPAIERGSTMREVVWGVTSEAVLDELAVSLAGEPGFERTQDRVWCVDPGGLVIGFQVSRKKPIEVSSNSFNTWAERRRVNQRSTFYERAFPVEVGHVVFFVKDYAKMEAFYTGKVGFVPSDRYPTGVFLRCDVRGGHHDMFLLQTPDGKVGLNHVAFTVRDINEVFGGGLHIDRCGWTTQLGPGRHPISSAYFWYVQNPAGALVEYYSDDDELDEGWEPREFIPSPTLFTEWGVDGGLDGATRRQKRAAGVVDAKFLTDRR